LSPRSEGVILFDAISSIYPPGILSMAPMTIDPHAAARNGDAAALRAFIRGAGDIDSRGRGQLERTPLHMAIEFGQVSVARLLIRLGADVNARDYRKTQPLHVAAEVGQSAIVKLLLDRGADPMALDTFGESPIHCIAQGGGLASETVQVRIIRQLLAAGASADAIGNAGRTPLWYAATRGKVKVVKALLHAGADSSKRAHGELGTPQDAAAGNPVESVLRALPISEAKSSARSRRTKPKS